jgi:hypothetical protein
MPALNFKAQFAPLVACGHKLHSIRAWRRRPFRKGDDLSFFTGMRTKACRRIRPNNPCCAAVPIEVNARRHYVIVSAGSRFYPEGRLAQEAVVRLAKADGFACVGDFWLFFEETHDGCLCGQLIEWSY